MSGERNDNVAVVDSSGDVFLDLGIELSRTDRLKVDIAREISRTIDAKNMTQAQAAEKLRCGQARVSQIVRGRLKGFTVERLLDYLVVLGMDVDVHLRQKHNDDLGTITLHARCAHG